MILQLIGSFAEKDIRDMTAQQLEFEEIRANLGPQTKEELWLWFKERIGVELGRVAVCPGHSAQLDVAWEIYSFAVTRILLVFSRGGGKTSLMAWIDYCSAEHYPGFESFTIGPGKEQGQRKYEHLLPLVVEGGVIGGKELPHVMRSIQTKTQLKNTSAMEIALGGDVGNANGPRVPRLHRDETELMQDDTYTQAGQIPAGRKTRDGRYVPAQIVDTSTMKYAEGRIDKEMQAHDLAVKEHRRPRMEVRISCIYEATAENPTCRSVPDDVRRTRLIELGLNPELKCDCDTYDSDVWPTDDPNKIPERRTLESVCQGRFFRSRGYKEFSDIKTLFLEADRATWNAEQECAEPSREGAYLQSYNEVIHGIRGYRPDPLNGQIFTGTDWGGDDEHAHGWWQLLEREVQVQSHVSTKIKTLPIGALVLFGEVFKDKIGNVALGELVLAREREWMVQFPGWRVQERYPDSANLGARLDWRDHLGLHTVSRIKKDFLEELKMVRTRVGGRKFYVDISACPWFDKSVKTWRQVNGREVHDFASHHMAQFRYVEHNLNVVARKLAKAGHRPKDSEPSAAEDMDRAPEREQEMRQIGQPMVIGSTAALRPRAVDRDPYVDEVVGAEDSPLREDGFTMPSEREYRELLRPR